MSDNKKGSGGKIPENFLTVFLLGGTSGALSKTITAPLERTKILLQLQDMSKAEPNSKPYTGIKDVLTRVPKE